MSEEAAFVAALAANPTDKTAALVFADWLDDRGDPRGPMLRDDEVRAWMAPKYENPLPKLRAALETGKGLTKANGVLARIGELAVPEIVPLLAHAKPLVRLRTVKALRRMANKARPAVPALLEFVKGKSTDDESARREAVRLLGVLRVKQDATDDLAKGLESEDDSDRLAAVEAMARLRSKTAVGSLCKALADTSEAVRRAAAQQLSYLASPTTTVAVEPLRTALADTSDFVRRRAAAALGKIGPKAAAAVPDVVRALSTAPAKECLAFVETLGKIGVGDEDALVAILGELRNPDARLAAITTLGEWPVLPPSAARAVLDLVKSTLGGGYQTYHLRRAGIHALARINPPTRDVLDTLREELDGENASLVADALGAMGPPAAALVPDLAAALARGQGKHRDPYAVARALGKIGGEGVEVLAKALGRDYPAENVIPMAAVAGLKEAGPAARPALPVLLARLKAFRTATPDHGVVSVVAALGGIGPDAAVAVPDMVALLLDDECEYHAAEALCQWLAEFGRAVRPFAEQIAGVLARPERVHQHQHVLRLLAVLVRHGFDDLGAFRGVLRQATADHDGNPYGPSATHLRTLAGAASAGLKALGPKAEAAVDDLVAADRKFDSESLRENILDALGAIGGSAVPHIRAAMTHPSHDTRVAAIRAIVASGDVSSESQDVLRKLETDANKTVRLRATAALQKLGTPKRKRK